MSELAKASFHSRLNREDRWDEYAGYRDYLKSQGVMDRMAWRVAGYFFPPADGKHRHEVEFSNEVAEAAEFWGPKLNLKIPEYAVINLLPPAIPPVHPGQWIKTDNPTPEETAGKIEESKGWGRLRRLVELDRTSDLVQDAYFVYAHRGAAPDEIKPESVPCRGAIEFLKWANDNRNSTTFYKDIMGKLLPSRDALDLMERFKDDGRQQFAMLDQFDREFHQEESDGESSGDAA